MWAGFGTPPGSVGGESSLGRSSRIERAAETAARSAARWTLPLPVTAPEIATRTRAPASSAKAPPRARIRACPDSSPSRIAAPPSPSPAGRRAMHQPWRERTHLWRAQINVSGPLM